MCLEAGMCIGLCSLGVVHVDQSSSSKMMETPSHNNKRLIGELIRGRDSTKKLQNLIRWKTDNDGSVSAEDLVMQILGSFSDSLSILSSSNSGDRKLDSGESEKKPAPVVKERRGCYKRRKTENPRIKIVDKIEDGYAWRKYGQKEILNAKTPRCYFRCTHKNKGCKAIKQVQKLEDGSKMFHITYFGYHTCQNVHKNSQMFLDSEAQGFFLHNFDDTKINNSSGSSSTNVQNTLLMEEKEDDSNAQSDDHMAFNTNHGQSSISLWNDMIGMIGDLETSYEDLFNNGNLFNNGSYFDDGFEFEENILL